MNNINNPTESSYSSQSAEENTTGHNNDRPSTSVITTNNIQPQTCPTQRNHVRVIPRIDLSSDLEDDDEDDEEDPICQMCWTIIDQRKIWHVSTLNTNANAVIYNITPFVCGDTGMYVEIKIFR